MAQDVIKSCKAVYIEVKRISSIPFRPYGTKEAAETNGIVLILSRLDYCDSIPTNTSQTVIQLLQRLPNVAHDLCVNMARERTRVCVFVSACLLMCVCVHACVHNCLREYVHAMSLINIHLYNVNQ